MRILTERAEKALEAAKAAEKECQRVGTAGKAGKKAQDAYRRALELLFLILDLTTGKDERASAQGSE